MFSLTPAGVDGVSGRASLTEAGLKELYRGDDIISLDGTTTRPGTGRTLTA